jgi:membrane peptidoglycan carboxypeptidase
MIRWTRKNFEKRIRAFITFRHALGASSRNLATTSTSRRPPATTTSRKLWKKLGVGNPPSNLSIALGVFEATPFEIATAYNDLPESRHAPPAGPFLKITRGGQDVTKPLADAPRPIARRDTTFLVTNMMRSVLNEGTGAGARAAGFTLDAAGKTGTTNDLRDAWFAGFTPELLTVVWVGFDDNQPVGLSVHRQRFRSGPSS